METESKRFNSPTEPDFFLQSLIDLVNRNPSMSVPITVTTKGIVLSGWIIGGKEYFDRFAKEFSAAIEDTAQKDKIRSMLAAPGTHYEPGKLRNEPPRYLHLRDARVLGGATPIPAKGVLWRVRADSVDSMTLGVLAG